MNSSSISVGPSWHARFPLHLARSIIFILLLLSAKPALCAPQEAQAFSKEELAELVSPIALYPDNLLQTILAAATFPDQIVDAGLQIKTKDDAAKIKDQ